VRKMTKKMKKGKTKLFLLAIMVSAALAGCGGGGGGTPAGTPDLRAIQDEAVSHLIRGVIYAPAEYEETVARTAARAGGEKPLAGAVVTLNSMTDGLLEQLSEAVVTDEKGRFSIEYKGDMTEELVLLASKRVMSGGELKTVKLMKLLESADIDSDVADVIIDSVTTVEAEQFLASAGKGNSKPEKQPVTDTPEAVNPGGKAPQGNANGTKEEFHEDKPGNGPGHWDEEEEGVEKENNGKAKGKDKEKGENPGNNIKSDRIQVHIVSQSHGVLEGVEVTLRAKGKVFKGVTGKNGTVNFYGLGDADEIYIEAEKPGFISTSIIRTNDGDENMKNFTMHMEELVVTDPACYVDADCDDSVRLTLDACENAGTENARCTHTPIECIDDMDCGGSTPYCLDGGTVNSVCIPCFTNDNCDDGDMYTADLCVAPGTVDAACNQEPIVCFNQGDCDDGDDYTIDDCMNPGTTTSYCRNTPVACFTDSDCDDSDPTTHNVCENPATPSSYCRTFMANEWLLVPGGEFVMGCSWNEEGCWDDSNPKHNVYLSDFYIQKMEVTNAQYDRCVDAGSCTEPESVASSSRPDYYTNHTFDDFPVINVTWDQAEAYCNWFGGDLPTEAQWEKAARGPAPSEVLYPWGDTPAPDCTVLNAYTDTGFCVGDTQRVASYPEGASYYGALDLSGNVLEWTHDFYASDYYNNSPYADPAGPADGYFHVARGGAWHHHYMMTSTIVRITEFPDSAKNGLGFRCATTTP